MDKINWIAPELTFSDLKLNLSEIYLNLGYGGQVPDEQFIEMINQLIEHIGCFCIPRAGFLISSGKIPDKNYLEIDTVRIKVGPIITRYLSEASHFAVFIATAGTEFDTYLDKLKAEGDIVSEFLTYSIGSEIAEATVRYVSTKINQVALGMGLKISHSYSPGYCSWHVREQKKLFSLLPDRPCGVELNDSSLMHPVKSVSGIIGIGKNIELTPHACDICGMITCFKRKTVV